VVPTLEKKRKEGQPQVVVIHGATRKGGPAPRRPESRTFQQGQDEGSPTLTGLSTLRIRRRAQ
jgi:hypothetical protein